MTRTSKLLLAVAFAGATLVLSAPETIARSLGADTLGKPESFQIISERNIFDAGRSVAEPKTNSEAPVVEHIVLKGTLTYEDKTHAFFEADALSRPNQTLRPLDSIAGCRILAVAHNSVKLEMPDGRLLTLTVGEGMRRIGDGAWEQLTAEPGSRTSEPVRKETLKAGPSRKRAQQ